MAYKVDLAKVPDWLGTALVSICASIIGLACMWGSLKSEVQAQVTAQAVDASDIKTLISGQAEVKATVNGLSQRLDQQHQDFLSLMNRYRSSRNNTSSGSTPGISQ